MKMLKQIIVINISTLLLFSFIACATDQSINKNGAQTMTAGSEVKAEIIGKILHITGTNGDDNISIQDANSRIVVYSKNREISSFPKSQISEAVVWGFNGNDTIKNMHNDIYNSIAFTAHGGNGNDIIWGGSGKNILDGGSGDNMIIGGTGENVFYNTGSGSSVFFWRGSDDSWAVGNKPDYNDAQLVFYNKDRAGKTSGTYMRKTYDYAVWDDEDISIFIDAINYVYDFTGSYRYAHNPRSGIRNGSNYFVLFDYPQYVFFARNYGATSTIQLKRGTFSKNTIIHEIAHNWQGTSKGDYDKVSHFKSLQELWDEFKNISWTTFNQTKPDAVSADFADNYGMSTWGEDWCTTFEAVFLLSTPSSSYGKSPKWNHKMDIVKRFLKRLKEL